MDFAGSAFGPSLGASLGIPPIFRFRSMIITAAPEAQYLGRNVNHVDDSVLTLLLLITFSWYCFHYGRLRSRGVYGRTGDGTSR
jgi:hypothetical protein